MRTNLILTTLTLSILLFSCQASQITHVSPESSDTTSLRGPAYSTYVQDKTNKHINTFETIMNAKSDSERLLQVKNFIRRQVEFYYIAQQYLQKFDSELDKIYLKKEKQLILSAEDKIDFEKIRYQNIISWEFNERNLNELLELYNLVLINAHDQNSPHQRACKWILAQIPKWLKEEAKTDNQLALISLSEHLNDVSREFQTNYKKHNSKLFPDFTLYFKLTKEQFDDADAKFKRMYDNRKRNGFDSFLEKKWMQYLTEREESGDQQLWFDDLRTPQALDVLEPDSGGKGNVTGNRFPQGKWAMTFDDGPNPTHTAGMYETLKSTNTHGTFFWQAQNIIKYPKLVKEAKDNGFSRALHSYTHANLPKLNSSGLNKEINIAADDFTKIIGEKPTLFRCPYGACGPSGSTIRQMIANRKMLHVAWNVDTLDWQDKNPDSIFSRTKKQVDVLGRGIILFHDIHSQSVIASKKVIQYLKTKYKVEPLNKLIEESRGTPFYTP